MIPGFHPGAWAGRLLGLTLRRTWPRSLLLNGLRPEERIDLALDAIDWGGIHDDAVWRVLSRFARNLERDAPEAARFAVELAGIVNPTTRDTIFEGVRALAERDDRSLSYGLGTFRALHAWITAHAGDLTGKRLLELGPGHSLVPALLFVAAGAERWVGADLYPLVSLEPGLYRRLREELAQDRGLVRGPGYYRERAAQLQRLDAALRLEGGRVVLDESRVAWRHPVDVAQLPFESGSFDVCLSNATFEHVRDPLVAVRESMRVLAPGGFGLHQIDLRDHRDFSRPLEFLRLDRQAWECSFGAADANRAGGPPLPEFAFTNRWRRSDFVAAFQAAGAVVLKSDALERVTVTAGMRAGFHADFRDRAQEDLEAVSLNLIVHKPHPGSAGP